MLLKTRIILQIIQIIKEVTWRQIIIFKMKLYFMKVDQKQMIRMIPAPIRMKREANKVIISLLFWSNYMKLLNVHQVLKLFVGLKVAMALSL